MHIRKQDMPVKVKAPGAEARQKTGFGDASACSRIGGEHFTMAAGTDLAPLLEGLEGDVCQAPHWGYVIRGELTVSYADGAEEEASAGDLVYWPPGHSVRVREDAELVLFSPEHEHTPVLEHIARKLGG